MNNGIEIIRVGSGIKRIVNVFTGRDVLLCGKRGSWLMMANFNQPDAKAELGTFASVDAAVAFLTIARKG